MENLQSNMIKKCRAKLIREAIAKSVLIGMAVGFGVCFIVAFVTWFVEFKGLWLSVGLCVGLWATVSVLLYFFAFKPSNRDVMKRLDKAGLEERMITMYELQGDTSYMAERQRADAIEAFEAAVARKSANASATVGSVVGKGASAAASAATANSAVATVAASGGVSLLTTQIPAVIMAIACAISPIGLGWGVVTGLSDYGIIPTGMELMQKSGTVGGLGRYYTVTFEVSKEGGGTLSNVDKLSRTTGETKIEQKVKAGESTDTVLALAECSEEGTYYFKMWVDELGKEYSGSPYLSLSDVRSSKTFTAVFGLVEDGVDDDFGYFFDPDDSNGGNLPGLPGSGDNEAPNQNNPGGGGMEGPGSAGDTLGNDTIIDGETNYGEVFGDYYGDAMGEMSDGSNGYPPELGDMLEGYFDSL